MMTRFPVRVVCAALTVLAATLAAGCVERQMTLVSEPEGARAYYNNVYVGQTPVTFHFTHYQSPAIRIERDGYRTMRAVQNVRVPLYQRFPLDFFAEVLLPVTLYDRHRFVYELEPAVDADVPALILRADELGRETVLGGPAGAATR